MYTVVSGGVPMVKRQTIDVRLALEAKGIVAVSFRNGPIEDVHAGAVCPTCSGKADYSHITQDEMKQIMKVAVNQVYKLLWLKEHDPTEYDRQITLGSLYTKHWDDPEIGTVPCFAG
jgi:peptide methionine sulfoxide reductase MsrA